MNAAQNQDARAALSISRRNLLLGVNNFRRMGDDTLRNAYKTIWCALESELGRNEAREISQFCAERADALLAAAKGRNALAHTTSFANAAIAELCEKAPASASRLHATLLAI